MLSFARLNIRWSAFMNGSERTTRDIKVSVRSEFCDERSRPDKMQWFFLYTVTISNQSNETVQLLERY